MRGVKAAVFNVSQQPNCNIKHVSNFVPAFNNSRARVTVCMELDQSCGADVTHQNAIPHLRAVAMLCPK
jgi:hypothetical protein